MQVWQQNRLNVGCFPGTHIDVNPCWQDGACQPCFNGRVTDVPISWQGHGNPTVALGSKPSTCLQWYAMVSYQDITYSQGYFSYTWENLSRKDGTFANQNAQTKWDFSLRVGDTDLIPCYVCFSATSILPSSLFLLVVASSFLHLPQLMVPGPSSFKTLVGINPRAEWSSLS